MYMLYAMIIRLESFEHNHTILCLVYAFFVCGLGPYESSPLDDRRMLHCIDAAATSKIAKGLVASPIGVPLTGTGVLYLFTRLLA